jgi:branched-chain amino acid aminotransferase
MNAASSGRTFTRNVARLRVRLPVDRAGLTAVLEDLLRRSGLVDAYVNMTLTRGVASGGRHDPRLFENRLYAYAVQFVWIVPLEDQEVGISLVVSSVERIPSASVDPKVKNFHWGDLLRGQFEAFDRGARAAVLVDRNGNLTEGPGFNIFAVVDGTLFTPDARVLDGITRRTVLELAEREGDRRARVPAAGDCIGTRRGGVPQQYRRPGNAHGEREWQPPGRWRAR